MAEIRLIIKDEAGHEWPVLPVPLGKMLVGRDSNCHILLTDDAVGRQHCVLHCDEMTFRVRDLDSKNGTYVNGQRIDKAGTLLVDGDEIAIGNTTIRVEIRMPGEATIDAL